jgi:hypothetical protein
MKKRLPGRMVILNSLTKEFKKAVITQGNKVDSQNGDIDG